MKKISRRRFVEYGIASAILVGLGGVLAYFFSRGSVSGSGGRKLPPGQYEVQGLQELEVDGVPQPSLDTWGFEVSGEVESPLKLNWDQFMLLPKIVSVSEFDCVTGWTRLDSSWEGVQFAEIARQARPTAKAKYATIECYGTPFYTTSLPLDYLMHDDVLFAYNLDGKPLAPKYGGPSGLWFRESTGTKVRSGLHESDSPRHRSSVTGRAGDTATPRTHGQTIGTDSLTMPKGNFSNCVFSVG